MERFKSVTWTNSNGKHIATAKSGFKGLPDGKAVVKKDQYGSNKSHYVAASNGRLISNPNGGYAFKTIKEAKEAVESLFTQVPQGLFGAAAGFA